jgi:starch synthase
MATGIRLADRVHTVSPGYADEIRHTSRRPHFYGAEGLENVIAYAHDSGRLIGILNGIAYPEPAAAVPTSTEPWPRMLQRGVLHWTAGHDRLPSEHFVAYQRLEALMRPTDTLRTILATVGRAMDQKMRLLREPGADGRTALDRILDNLGEQGIWIILGTGDPDYEGYLSWTAARRDNLIFLNGYSAAGADLLYATAHLFIMPSSYEPCGISQMLAMRHGCPCVVHRVGGLRDTIIDGCNGFSFQGWTIAEQVENFVTTALAAIDMQRQGGENWETMRRRAAAARFQWDTAARQYCEKLYDHHF